MRSYVASAVLAAVFVLLPAAAGYAPALSQDFSITNETPLGSSWMAQLQEWWDLHAYYPLDASERNEDGTVKVHMLIHPDGKVWTIEVVSSSGSRILDEAGVEVFHNMYLRPFPAGTPAPQADVYVSLHYVLAHRHG